MHNHKARGHHESLDPETSRETLHERGLPCPQIPFEKNGGSGHTAFAKCFPECPRFLGTARGLSFHEAYPTAVLEEERTREETMGETENEMALALPSRPSCLACCRYRRSLEMSTPTARLSHLR